MMKTPQMKKTAGFAKKSLKNQGIESFILSKKDIDLTNLA